MARVPIFDFSKVRLPPCCSAIVATKLGNKEVTARFHSETDVQIGSKVKFSFDLEKVSYFDPKMGKGLINLILY